MSPTSCIPPSATQLSASITGDARRTGIATATARTARRRQRNALRHIVLSPHKLVNEFHISIPIPYPRVWTLGVHVPSAHARMSHVLQVSPFSAMNLANILPIFGVTLVEKVRKRRWQRDLRKDVKRQLLF